MFGNVVLDIEKAAFDEVFDAKKKQKKTKLDTDLDAKALEEVIVDYKKVVKLSLIHIWAMMGNQSPRPVSPSDGETGHPDVVRDKLRFPLLAAYDLCLKCSHLFNILDARGAISVTERVGVIARVRALAVGIAKAWVDQQKNDPPKSDDATSSENSDEPEPVGAKKSKREKLVPATA